MAETDVALKLTIEALDKFSGTMAKLTSQMAGVNKQVSETTDQSKKQTSANTSLIGKWTELNSVLSVGKMAYAQLQKVVKELIGDTVEYAQQVRDMARITGMTAEATSTLVQAADDAEVSVGSLERAMRMAIRKGFEPTLENLAALSDEYNALTDPMEKNRLLMSKFGRSAFEMAKFMEQGSAAIKESAMQAQVFGLILSEDQVKAAREYEKAIDNLGDAFNGLKYMIGNAVIPVLTAASKAFVILLTATKQVTTLLGVHNKEVANTATTYEEYTEEVRRAAIAAGYQVDAEGNLMKITGERRGRVVQLITANYELTEAEFKLTRAIAEQTTANEKSDDVLHAQVDTLALLEHAQRRAAEAAQEAADEMNAAWAKLDTSPLDNLLNIENLIEWRAVGGAVLADFITSLENAAKAGIDVTEEMNFAQAAAIAMQLTVGQIDLSQAKTQAKELGIPWKEIETLTAMSNDHLQALIKANGQSVKMKVTILETTIANRVQGGGGGGHTPAMEFGGRPGPGAWEVGEAGTEGLIVGPGGVEVIPHRRWLEMRRQMMGDVGHAAGGFAFDPDTLRQAGVKNPEYSTFTQQSIATKQIISGVQAGGGGTAAASSAITSAVTEAVTSSVVSAVAEVVRAVTPSTAELTAAVLAPSQAAAAQSAQASAELLEEVRKMVRILQAQGSAGDVGNSVRSAMQFSNVGG